MSMTSEVETFAEPPPLRAAKSRTAPVDPPEPREFSEPPRAAPAKRVMTAPRVVEPAKPRVPPPMATHVSQKSAEAQPTKKSVYSVQKGETLYGVARKHSLNVAQLAKWNNIPITTEVQAGQKLVVAENEMKSKSATTAAPVTKPAKKTATTTKGRTSGNTDIRKLAASNR
jgi:LysM repeat protein